MMSRRYPLFGILFCCSLLAANAAEAVAEKVWQSAVTITGQIKDGETGEGLPGVTVLEKGTSNGTVTDLEGKYKLKVSAEAVLVYSFIGYQTQEIPVGNKTVMDVSLGVDVQSLEEVVVIGYGEVKKSDLTGSVVSMDSKQLAQTNKVDAASALQGQVPGVVIQHTDNKPGGSGINIRVRGSSTINTSETAANGGYTPGQNPLYIVDGMFVSDISFLNPSDIERMDVLKDASATAIYGARGSSGVVIIQTKKGSSGKLNIRYNNYVGFKQVYHLPSIYNGKQYVNFLKDDVVGTQYSSGNLSYTRDDVDLTDYLSTEEQENIADGVSTDWVSLIKQNGFQTNHTVDISGGNGSTIYGVGGAYTYDAGTVKGEDFTRYNLRGNFSSDLTKWLNIGYNNYVTMATQNTGSWEAFRSAYRLKPIGRVYNEDGSLKFFPTAKETQITNPLFDVKNVIHETKYLQYLGDILLKITPAKGLTLTTKLTPNIKYTRYGAYQGLYSKGSVGIESNTKAEATNYVDMMYTWDNIVNYDRQMGADSKLNATLVFSRFQQKDETYAMVVQGFSSDSYLFYNLDAGSTITSYSSSYSKQTLQSYTARVNYSLKEKYLLTLTGRYDGASILAEGHKWAFFPSAAVAWRLIDENFMKGQHVLTNAKVRLSYGQTGNTGTGGGLGPLLSQSNLATSYTDLGDASVAAAYVTGLANKNLTWERTAEVNIGFDYGFWKNRITGSIDVYHRKTTGIIFYRPLPLATGYSGTYDNVGEATNKGIEFGINSVNIDNGRLKWTTSFNLAANQNRIDKLYGGENSIIFSTQGATYIHQVGKAVGSIYTYKAQGIWQADEADEAAKFGQYPGQVKVKDVNGDGQITTDDRTIIGQVSPKWTGGFTSTMNYRNFDFSFSVFTSQGNKMLSNFHNAFAFAYDSEPTRLWNGYRTNYWTPTNPTNHWFQPGNGGAYQVAMKYRDVSFVKVNYITLGYTLPRQMLDNVHLSNLRIYATLQNPFIFTSYDGWDPEGAGRNTWGAAFLSRTYIAGINVSF